MFSISEFLKMIKTLVVDWPHYFFKTKKVM